MKLLAIDGNSIVNRAFYGIRMLNAPDGTPTNGVYGFLTILQRLLDEEKPDGVCVTFDLRAPTFRHLQYEGYKAQRKGMPEELAVQMPLLKETLDAMGILRLEKEGFEADDLLGTISRRCEGAGHECVIVTGDKDSFQLIGGSTRVLHVKTRMGQTETVNYTKQRFEEEYGFEPIKMIDLKALMGDASDNIPGVPGVGEKTALDLVRRYGSIENIYAALDQLDVKEGVRKKLREGEDSARMSYELATILTDAPVEIDLEAARWNYDFKPELYSLFLRLGFTKFIEKYHLTPAAGEETPEMFEGECTIEEILSPADVTAALARIGEDTAYILTEDGLDFIVFQGGESGTAWVLDKENFPGDYTAALRALFASPVKKAGHNIKDTLRALLDLGIESGNWVFDSALAAYLLDATAGSYDIDRLCMKYCAFRPWSGETGEESGQMSLLDVPDAAARRGRAASLGAAIACLEEKMLPLLRERGAEKLYFDIELPLCAVLADMEHAGFLVDKAALHDFGESMTGTIDELQKSIWDMAGEEFNINSPKQLGHILFEKLMLPSGKKTKTGWSTNADILEKLRDKHPIVNEILEYRTLTKLKSTYADGLLKVIGPDGRIHTCFQMTVTATGRLSSTEPNLQNIPIRKEFGAQIRKMFVAPPGMVLVDADYSQIELRLLAHISGDENMIGAFRSGEDIHAVTASQVFGVPLAEVTPLQRSRAKAVNFGIVYGISAWSLA
ncbi:MAG: DNA polymerase I, partial [Oscillospiraceae bacterium]